MRQLVFILTQIVLLSGFAQQYSYRHYTVFEGLPQNQITRLMQGDNLFMNIATKAGTCFFDGKNFTPHANAEFLNGNINGFIKLNGDLYCYMKNSVIRYDANKIIKRYTFSNIEFERMRRNERTNEWYVVSEHCVYIVDPWLNCWQVDAPDSGYVYDFFRLNDQYLMSTGNGVYSICRGGKTTLVTAGFGGYIQPVGNKLYFALPTGDDSSGSARGIYSWDGRSAECIYSCGNNILSGIMTLTNDHHFLIARNSSTWLKIDTRGVVLDYDSLPDVTINAMLEDNFGYLWLGTESGLYHLQSFAFRNYTEKSGMPKYVWSIFEDKDSNLVFATYNSKIAVLKNNVLSIFNDHESSFVQGERFYMQGFCNMQGQWMIPTNYRVYIYDHGQSSFLSLIDQGQYSTILCTYEDTLHKDVYFGTTHGVFIYHLPDNTLKHVNTGKGNVLSMDFDKTGRLWACTSREIKLVKDCQVINNDSKETFFKSGAISCKRDPRGNMWIANQEGLFLYDYSKIKKVLDGQYTFISLYLNQFIVAGTITGFAYIDLEKYYHDGKKSIHFFDRYNGFTGIECGQNGTCVDSRGNIWIPTSESVVKFMPWKIKEDTVGPPAIITLFQSAKRDLIWSDVRLNSEPSKSTLSFPSSENNIRINFFGVSFPCPERVMYKHRMVGYDDNWITTTSNEVVYTNLPPGDYIFEVMASNENGYWSIKPTSLPFRIVPAWYQTLAFKLGGTIFVLLANVVLVIIIIRRRRKKIEHEHSVERELINMQVNTINAQLDPHFIFNAITAIGSEVQENNTDKAYAYFVKLSQLLRSSLSQNNKITRSLEDELQFVINYLNLQKFRFEDRFVYHLDVFEKVDQSRQIPKMSLQIFVENAVKHGLENREEKGGELWIHVSENEQTLQFIIEDNGVGRNAASRFNKKSTGVGLFVFNEFFNIMNRYNKNKAEFIVEDLYHEDGSAAGTRVTVNIPVDYQYFISG